MYAKLENGRMFYADHTMTATDAEQQGFLEVIRTEKPNDGYPRYEYSFEEQEGKLVQLWNRFPDWEAARAAQAELEATDYKVIKCYEYSLAGRELPYDAEALHTARQTIRDEVNRLKRCEDEVGDVDV